MIDVIRQNKGWAFLAVALLLALVVLLNQSPPSDWTRAQQLGLRLQNASLMEMLVFMGVGVLATSVGLPRQMLAFISGFAFGVLPGVLLSLVLAGAGCALTFVVSRLLFRKRLKRRLTGLIEKLDAFTEHDAFLKILILRFQPLGTNLMTNVAAGISRISAPTFLAASLLGYIPQMLVFALMGSGIRVGSNTQLLVSFALLLVSIALGAWLWRRSTHRS